MIDGHLGVLVEIARFMAVCRQESAGMILHVGHLPANRHTVHVHIHRRQENADLLPVAGRARASGWLAGNHHAPVCRRQYRVSVFCYRPVRVAEEEQEKAREDKKERGAAGTDEPQRGDRKEQRAADERPAGRIDPHLRNGNGNGKRVV